MWKFVFLCSVITHQSSQPFPTALTFLSRLSLLPGPSRSSCLVQGAASLATSLPLWDGLPGATETGPPQRPPLGCSLSSQQPGGLPAASGSCTASPPGHCTQELTKPWRSWPSAEDSTDRTDAIDWSPGRHTRLISDPPNWCSPGTPECDSLFGNSLHRSIQWNITQPLKEWNNAICSNVDGARDCHTEWSRTEKERYHMPSLIRGIYKEVIQTNLCTWQKQTHRLRKQVYGCWRKGSLGDLGRSRTHRCIRDG